MYKNERTAYACKGFIQASKTEVTYSDYYSSENKMSTTSIFGDSFDMITDSVILNRFRKEMVL